LAKRALITGITGQDGSYLAELLIRFLVYFYEHQLNSKNYKTI